MRPSQILDSMPETDSRRSASSRAIADDVELFDEGDQLTLSIQLPGFDRDDITVSWDEGRLSVSAVPADNRRRRRTPFSRSFRVSKAIEPDEIEAQYRNGVLAVRIPNVDPRVRGTRIDVQAG